MDQNQPLVSVIIPFYNTPADFLREAIESVLAQTYDRWELLLVDDGGESAGIELAAAYVARDPARIRLLAHPGRANKGLSEARNLGLDGAKGELIAFLDADDLWLPAKLAEQVDLLRAFPQAGMVYGATEYWYSWSGRPADQARDFQPDLALPLRTLLFPPAPLIAYLQGSAAVPCTCSILIRREVIEQIGGFEPSFRGMYEDQVFYVKLCASFPIVIANTCWDKYRQHSASMTSLAGHRQDLQGSRRFFLDWTADYLITHHNNDPQLWAVVAQQRWLAAAPDRFGAGRPSNLLRLGKKWLLRLERLLLSPETIERRWARREMGGQTKGGNG